MTCGKDGHPSFYVRGLPVPQGSTKAYMAGGKPRITSTSKGLGPWRRLIADQAQQHAPPMPWDGPVALHLVFYLPRPKSEPKSKRTFPTRRPDLDKLQRSAFDALTSVFWQDDSQVVEVVAEKRWANDPFTFDGRRIYGTPSFPLPPGVFIEARNRHTWPLLVEPFNGLTPRQLMDELRRAMQ